MLDLILTIALAVPTVVMAYLGGHMAVSPPQTSMSKERYKLSFAILSIWSLILITTIGIRQHHAGKSSQIAQDTLRLELEETKSVAQRGEKQLQDIMKENASLQKNLTRSQETTIEGFQTLLDEGNRKHTENVDRFATLLNDQQQLARKTELGINRLLTPTPQYVRLSFQIAIPGDQYLVKPFIARIKANHSSMISVAREHQAFLDVSKPEEAELSRFLSNVRVDVFFVKKVDTKRLLSSASEPNGYTPIRDSELNLTAYVPVLPWKRPPFGSTVDDKSRTLVSYESRSDTIFVHTFFLQTEIQNTDIPSLLDLAEYTVVLRPSRPLLSVKIEFDVNYFRLDPPVGKPVIIQRFNRFYTGVTPLYVARVSYE